MLARFGPNMICGYLFGPSLLNCSSTSKLLEKPFCYLDKHHAQLVRFKNISNNVVIFSCMFIIALSMDCETTVLNSSIVDMNMMFRRIFTGEESIRCIKNEFSLWR